MVHRGLGVGLFGGSCTGRRVEGRWLAYKETSALRCIFGDEGCLHLHFSQGAAELVLDASSLHGSE